MRILLVTTLLLLHTIYWNTKELKRNYSLNAAYYYYYNTKKKVNTTTLFEFSRPKNSFVISLLILPNPISTKGEIFSKNSSNHMFELFWILKTSDWLTLLTNQKPPKLKKKKAKKTKNMIWLVFFWKYLTFNLYSLYHDMKN